MAIYPKCRTSNSELREQCRKCGEPLSPPPSPPPEEIDEQNLSETVSMGEWIGTFLLTAIPLVNFIFLIVWAASSTTNPSKKNYAKAMLLMIVIGIVLSVALSAATGTFPGSLYRRGYYR